MSTSKCAGCGKTVYPTEKVRAIDQDWHKGCLKCTICGGSLNLKNIESYERKPYCRSHRPDPKRGGGVQTAHGTGAPPVGDYNTAAHAQPSTTYDEE